MWGDAEPMVAVCHHRAKTGPWAVHVGPDVPSVVSSVLRSIKSNLLLGMALELVVAADSEVRVQTSWEEDMDRRTR